MQPLVFQDTHESIESILGLDHEGWWELNLMETMNKIIIKSADRIVVGEPLRNNTASFGQWTCTNTIIVGNLMPKFLQLFLRYLASIPIYITNMRARRYLLPTLKEPMKNISQKRTDPSFKYEEPMDKLSRMAVETLDADGKDARKRHPGCGASFDQRKYDVLFNSRQNGWSFFTSLLLVLQIIASCIPLIP